jgi:hypothetical protein
LYSLYPPVSLAFPNGVSAGLSLLTGDDFTGTSLSSRNALGNFTKIQIKNVNGFKLLQKISAGRHIYSTVTKNAGVEMTEKPALT